MCRKHNSRISKQKKGMRSNGVAEFSALMENRSWSICQDPSDRFWNVLLLLPLTLTEPLNNTFICQSSADVGARLCSSFYSICGWSHFLWWEFSSRQVWLKPLQQTEHFLSSLSGYLKTLTGWSFKCKHWETAIWLCCAHKSKWAEM